MVSLLLTNEKRRQSFSTLSCTGARKAQVDRLLPTRACCWLDETRNLLVVARLTEERAFSNMDMTAIGDRLVGVVFGVKLFSCVAGINCDSLQFKRILLHNLANREEQYERMSRRRRLRNGEKCNKPPSDDDDVYYRHAHSLQKRKNLVINECCKEED